jgi:LmbE family N-acetylglucosaminyl deacetylase
VSSVLVIHAHPDDEVFATAAATAAFHRAGARVTLRVATGGEAGELATAPGLTEVQARRARQRRLGRASRMVGVDEWAYLTRPGQWVDTRSTLDPRTLANAAPDTVTSAVRHCLDAVRPDIVLTVGRDGLTRHPDHIAINTAVSRALRLPGWQPVEAWGARLRRSDVATAHQQLRQGFGDQPIGSGRVVGAADDETLHSFEAGKDFAAQRATALDCYAPGLGTTPLSELQSHYPGRGDSLLLRGLFDATSWTREYYESIPTRR